MVLSCMGLSCGTSAAGAAKNQEGRNKAIICGVLLGIALDAIAGTALLTVGLLGVYHVIPLASAGYWAMVGVGGSCLIAPIFVAVIGCKICNKPSEGNYTEIGEP